MPIAKRLGLGSVLGYLLAGVALGPWGIGLVGDVDHILHFAEFGVVLLLFVIGLELQPSRLWTMRQAVFGAGSAQVLGTGAIIAAIAAGFGLPLAAAIVAGLSLALSSTAFALQTLAEKNQLATRYGRTSFAILLFQDLAAVPLLVVVPFLGAATVAVDGDQSLLAIARAVGAVVVTAVAGRYLLRYALRIVARSGVSEVFTAAALLTVVLTALLMEYVGLSMALGAFLAGVLLADSDYRHELEADIEPFKGLLLGLFFMAVGMSIELGLVGERPWTTAGLVIGLLAIKGLTLYLLGRAFKLDTWPALGLAAALSQGGEFAFIIFDVAAGAGVMARADRDLLVVVVGLSMAITPLIFGLYLWAHGRRRKAPGDPAYDRVIQDENEIIIAGFGRVGQIVGRTLAAMKVGFTALEINPEQVDFVKRYGSRVYYGDASRLDLLRAAKADKAHICVIAIDDIEASLRLAATIRRHFPHLKVFARARNRQHVYRLMDLGVTDIFRETFGSSLEMAENVLRGLGLGDGRARGVVQRFREHDERRLLQAHAHHWDEDKMIDLAKQSTRELRELFEQDARGGSD